MMEKVKVTREVAGAIEALRSAEFSDFGIVLLVAEKEEMNVVFNNIDPLKILADWIEGNEYSNSENIQWDIDEILQQEDLQ